jgi:hypothetical protein
MAALYHRKHIRVSPDGVLARYRLSVSCGPSVVYVVSVVNAVVRKKWLWSAKMISGSEAGVRWDSRPASFGF